MAEPSQSRPDLSGIHPLKRVLLIVLGFMFGVSPLFALATQFVWVQVDFECPGSEFPVIGLANGIVLQHMPSDDNAWDLRFDHGQHSENDRWPADWPDRVAEEPNAVGIPSLFVVVIRDWRLMSINHFWLSSITAALYLFTRWRIRRTARLQRVPS